MNKPSHRACFTASSLALAAFALRALVPLGYMPASLGMGGPWVLCPGNNPAISRFLAHLSTAGEHHHHGSSTGSGDDTAWAQCPFASAAVSAAAIDNLPALSLAPEALRTSGFRQTPVLSPGDPPHRARAPPSLQTIEV